MTLFLPSPHSFSSARVSKSSRHDQVRALEPLNLAVERCATRAISCPLLGRRRYRENSWLHCTRYLIFRRNAWSGQSPLYTVRWKWSSQTTCFHFLQVCMKLLASRLRVSSYLQHDFSQRGGSFLPNTQWAAPLRFRSWPRSIQSSRTSRWRGAEPGIFFFFLSHELTFEQIL